MINDFVEEQFVVVPQRTQHRLSCIFHRKSSPYIDEENREHVVILCHGYLANKNSAFLPELSRNLIDRNENRFHSVRFDFHGCGDSTGRENWDYGGYEDEAKDDLRAVVEFIRNSTEKKYFVRALMGHSRAGTTVLLYSAFFDDVPQIVNICGRFRLNRGIFERFSAKQLDDLEKNGSLIVPTWSDGDFRVTKKGIERRQNLDVNQIEKIRQARVLNIWGDRDVVMPEEEIHLFQKHLQNTIDTQMIIIPSADHCFEGTEKQLFEMILSKHFQSTTHQQQMETQNPVGSTSNASGDELHSSQIRSNSNHSTPTYEGNYQVDISATHFELDSITTSYTGLMRIYRLLYIADHCPSLRQEALIASLKYIQETHFTTLYKQIIDEVKKQNFPLPNEFDMAWHERTQRNYVHKLEKLDTDLRNFRTNSIKDSIRRGHDDLGDHYLDAGDFFNAVRCYVRSRDYCVTPRHMITMCMNVIKASFYMQNWSNVLSYVSKAEQAIESLESTTKSGGTNTSILNPMDTSNLSSTNAMTLSDQILASRLKVYAGISELATKRYKLAARHFLGVSFDHCSNNFQDLISPQTLIQYVCLCSLATFERSEIHRLILMSPNMKQYLELEPSIRDILHKFYETSYSFCLGSMSQLEPIFALDQYLAPHLRTLFYEIRHRIIITYFLPYKNASMTVMARQLNTTIEVLEDELVHLIRTGKIKARIDSKNKILYVADTDQRWYAYQHALNITKQSENLTRALLLRSAIIKTNLIVKDETVPPVARSPTNNNNNNNPSSRRQYVPNLGGNMMMDEGDLSDEGTM